MNSSIPPIGTHVGTGPARPSSVRSLLAGAALLSLALWYVPGAHLALYPLRLFVTLIHEGGHALATVLTGGHVVSLQVNPDTSGVTLSQGGIFGLISMAGYVGATAFGSFCLHLSRRRQGGRQGLILLAAVICLVTGFWVNPIGPGFFTFVCGAAMAVLLVAAARKLSERSSTFLLSFLAVQLSLNAIFDLRNLLWMTTQTAADNDAVFMARAYGMPPWFWATVWGLVAGVIFAASLRSWWRSTK